MIKFENKSNGRFYYITQQKDMFGDDVLIVIRGGYNVSMVRSYGFNCPKIIEKEIQQITKKRLQRGYELIS